MKRSTTRTAGITIATLGLAALALPLAGAASATEQPQHIQVGVCHATSSDTNPYVWLLVDDDSVKAEGHLEHRNEPNKTWKTDGVWNTVAHKAGDAKPDLIEGLDTIDQATCESTGTSTGEPSDPATDEPTDSPTTSTPTDDPSTSNPTDDPSTSNPTDPASPTEPAAPTTPVTVVDPTSQTIPSTGGSVQQLAHTGSATGLLVGLGAALLATGAVFVLAGRRTPEHA